LSSASWAIKANRARLSSRRSWLDFMPGNNLTCCVCVREGTDQNNSRQVYLHSHLGSNRVRRRKGRTRVAYRGATKKSTKPTTILPGKLLSLSMKGDTGKPSSFSLSP
jgi:hypothetical protein